MKAKTRAVDEAEAIANGVARYVCDPETGDVRFEWIKPDDKSIEAEGA